MAYIYLITNKINGKQYVGKTENTIDERWKEHKQDYKKERCEKRPLYDAMSKYGVENFEIEEIEYLEQGGIILSNRETYWIEQLGTYGHNGYNATKGGDGSTLYNHEEFINLYNLGYSSKRISEKTGATVETINKTLKNKGINPRRSDCKLIDQFDLNGNYIKTFFGSIEAAEWCVENGISKSKHSASNHILDCCKGKLKSSGGYKWSYKNIPQ